MASSDEEDFAIINSTLPETANNKQKILLKPGTQQKYEVAYTKFMQWNKNQSLSEDTVLEYLKELSRTKKFNSVCSVFSMLRAIFELKHNINLKTYTKVTAFLKKLCAGLKSTKSPFLPAEGVEKFLKEAPDHKYLSMKVALIFAISGACTVNELIQITKKHIEEHGEMFVVSVPGSDHKHPRTFAIHGENYHIVKKYKALRRKREKSNRFFQTYSNGKCISQPIGRNTFGAIPRKVATYLGLPNPESYTAHSFKETAMKLQAGPRWAICMGGLNGTKLAETSRPLSEPLPSNSSENSSMFPPETDQPSRENTTSPIHVEVKSTSRPSSPCENLDIQDLIRTSLNQDDNLTFNFNGCRFTNCFNK